ncbi:malectin domain-containing carbohydrate-binding protein [Cerasicoccus frondis]|uniref:malectin domain-containing carbohydrate-binding protein n=1 Tax=Cerasicoccus frondis TaxID=490090 RepID=UPI0028525E31|nr:malectin domain-containing carbohydrate-binding protein [Cerasicoccus frondis]
MAFNIPCVQHTLRLIILSVGVLFGGATVYGVSSSDFELRERNGMNYNLFVPYGDDAPEPEHQYPLVIYLHGLGGGRNPTQPVSGNQSYFRLAEDPDNPTFIIAPVSGGEGWWGSYVDDIAALAVELQAEFPIDPDRVYVTGVSAGGQGTWLCLEYDSSVYAAAVPIYGGKLGDGDSVEKFSHIPIWCFHAADDGVVSVGNSDTMIDFLRRDGGTPIYTRYASGGHSVSGSAYSTTLMREWLFAQRRGAPTDDHLPRVEIDEATGEPKYISGNAFDSSGVAYDVEDGNSVASVEVINYRGGSLSAAGDGVWSASGIPLRYGGENLIQYIATGSSYNSSRGGQTTFSAVDVVFASDPSNDEQAPDVVINDATGSLVCEGVSCSIQLMGRAMDAIGVTAVEWSNNRGGSGAATGLEDWVVSDVPITTGSNVITVFATDSAGNIGVAYIVIDNGAPSNQPPQVSLGDGMEVYLPVNSVAIEGSLADDGRTAVQVQWSKVSGPGEVSFSAPGDLATDVTFSETGIYILQLLVDDGDWSDSAQIEVVVQPAPGALVIAVNCAGDEYTAINGEVFQSDSFVSGGNGGNLYKDILGTEDDVLYGRYRYNDFTYSMPVAPGSYVVDLYFADASLTRMFDLFVEGSLVLPEFSPASEAGIRVATSKRYTVSVADGALDITVGEIFEGPMLSAFSIREVGIGGVVANLPPSVSAGTDIVLLLPTMSTTLSGVLNDDGLPDDGVLTYQWTQVSGPEAVTFADDASLQSSVTFPTAGDYVLRLSASDGELSGSDTITVSLRQSGASGEVIAAVNCGEFNTPYASESELAEFSVDDFYEGGSAAGVTADIADTEDDTLFHRYRYGNHRYEIPATDGGEYTVTLFFSDNGSAGTRVFDVLIEGETVLDGFDIRAEVERNTALRKTFTPTVNDGFLSIELRNVTGNGKINAILVARAAPVQEGGMADWLDGYGLQGGDREPTADPDHDGLMNIEEYLVDSDPTLQSERTIFGEVYDENDLRHLTLQLTYNTEVDDVVVEFAESSNLIDWDVVSTIQGMVITGGNVIGDTSNGAMRTVTVMSSVGMPDSSSRCFMRVNLRMADD